MNYDTALITGASGGIGYELAAIAASHVRNVVLVARNRKRLEAVKAELEKRFSARITVIASDLAAPGAADGIHRSLAHEGIPLPDILINNAGFGEHGAFVETDMKKNTDMLAVNVVALTELTRLFAAEMVKHGKGRILNVASTAAFQPGPLMAVYYASKAYVLSFSEALAYELKGTGVTVTALCPGPTKTGFARVASLENSHLFKYGRPADAADVARYGYRAMLRGKTVAVHGLVNKIVAFSVRTSPRKLLPVIVHWLHSPVQGG